MRLYLDADTIIYALESLPPFRDTVHNTHISFPSAAVLRM
jgi:hypothetical protein